MTDDLNALHTLAESVLDALDGPARAKLMRSLAKDIRTVNQRRMARQIAPDGEAWPKRKPRARPKSSTRAVRFLYNSSGVIRLADMRSWRQDGPYKIGFDREVDGIRTFRDDRITKMLPGAGPAEASEVRGGRGAVRRRAQSMFRGLRTNRYLRAGAGPEEAWVAFVARAERLAKVHHYGLRDRVTRDGPETDYPARELLGFSEGDEARILNRFIDHAGDALGWGRRVGR